MNEHSSLVWLVDFDGTVINLDLGARFSEWVFANQRVTKIASVVRLLGAPINLTLRKLERGQLFRAWSWGLSESEIQTLFADFLKYIAPELVVNNLLLHRLRMTPESNKILLTGCPQDLAVAFLRAYNINDFDDVIGMTVTRQIVISRHPFGRSKLKFAKKCGLFIAVGDSWQDRFILRLAHHAIVIPGVSRMEKLATRFGWEVFPPQKMTDI